MVEIIVEEEKLKPEDEANLEQLPGAIGNVMNVGFLTDIVAGGLGYIGADYLSRYAVTLSGQTDPNIKLGIKVITEFGTAILFQVLKTWIPMGGILDAASVGAGIGGFVDVAAYALGEDYGLARSGIVVTGKSPIMAMGGGGKEVVMLPAGVGTVAGTPRTMVQMAAPVSRMAITPPPTGGVLATGETKLQPTRVRQ